MPRTLFLKIYLVFSLFKLMKCKPKYRKAVFIVTYAKVKNKIYYLVLKRKLHWKGWEFPKGGVEIQKAKPLVSSSKCGQTKRGIKHYELKRNAVKREVLEETGLKVLKIKRFGEKGKYNYDKKYLDRPGFKGQTYSLFSAEVKKNKVKVDNIEHNNFEWVEYEKALKILTWKNQVKSLKIVDKWLLTNSPN